MLSNLSLLFPDLRSTILSCNLLIISNALVFFVTFLLTHLNPLQDLILFLLTVVLHLLFAQKIYIVSFFSFLFIFSSFPINCIVTSSSLIQLDGLLSLFALFQ